jgi:hypothetical protein
MLLFGGLVVTGIGAGLGLVGSTWTTFAQVVALGAGVLLALGSVARRLRETGWDLEERIETSALVSLAGFTALLALFGADKSWDSIRLLFGVLFGLSLLAAAVVLLPATARRVAISLLIVFHFGGIVTAVTSIDPPGSTGPWVAKMAWAWVYRPYLHFHYLSNAYHFYSPDPGPPSHLWFAVRYSDGNYTWVRLPDRANSPIGMHYQRMLALPEHTFNVNPIPPMTQAQLILWAERTGLTPQRDSWEEINLRREMGSRLNYKPPIPVVVDLEANLQYREPTDPSKAILQSVARHVFRNAEQMTGYTPPEGVKVVSVKMYRATLQVLSPAELAAGLDPGAKQKYLPYFLGEFDGKGRLLNPRDPFLYWYIPIAFVPKNFPDPLRPDDIPRIQVRVMPKDGVLMDFLEAHAAGVQAQPQAEKKI